jgi:hypothetical protein
MNGIDRQPHKMVSSDQRIFLEFPENVPGIEMGEPIQAELERTVVTSDFFGENLPEKTILAQHKC